MDAYDSFLAHKGRESGEVNSWPGASDGTSYEDQGVEELDLDAIDKAATQHSIAGVLVGLGAGAAISSIAGLIVESRRSKHSTGKNARARALQLSPTLNGLTLAGRF